MYDRWRDSCNPGVNPGRLPAGAPCSSDLATDQSAGEGAHGPSARPGQCPGGRQEGRARGTHVVDEEDGPGGNRIGVCNGERLGNVLPSAASGPARLGTGLPVPHQETVLGRPEARSGEAQPDPLALVVAALQESESPQGDGHQAKACGPGERMDIGTEVCAQDASDPDPELGPGPVLQRVEHGSKRAGRLVGPSGRGPGQRAGLSGSRTEASADHAGIGGGETGCAIRTERMDAAIVSASAFHAEPRIEQIGETGEDRTHGSRVSS